jgi:hypothetical protein
MKVVKDLGEEVARQGFVKFSCCKCVVNNKVSSSVA